MSATINLLCLQKVSDFFDFLTNYYFKKQKLQAMFGIAARNDYLDRAGLIRCLILVKRQSRAAEISYGVKSLPPSCDRVAPRATIHVGLPLL